MAQCRRYTSVPCTNAGRTEERVACCAVALQWLPPAKPSDSVSESVHCRCSSKRSRSTPTSSAPGRTCQRSAPSRASAASPAKRPRAISVGFARTVYLCHRGAQWPRHTVGPPSEYGYSAARVSVCVCSLCIGALCSAVSGCCASVMGAVSEGCEPSVRTRKLERMIRRRCAVGARGPARSKHVPSQQPLHVEYNREVESHQ